MAERGAPQVVLRGHGKGDNIILPMGGLKAHITRMASRTETGGHWALGEAWQEPGFDNPPHVHDEAEAFYVLEGSYTFYTDADPAEGIGPGTFASFRLVPSTDSEQVPYRVDSADRAARDSGEPMSYLVTPSISARNAT